uniref:Uncharacterized protein n=1 Tax=Romanomermis culicivorax TaxID=13658 RepID=A0A915HGL6_ROMCU
MGQNYFPKIKVHKKLLVSKRVEHGSVSSNRLNLAEQHQSEISLTQCAGKETPEGMRTEATFFNALLL